jgi:hypothetical protein
VKGFVQVDFVLGSDVVGVDVALGRPVAAVVVAGAGDVQATTVAPPSVEDRRLANEEPTWAGNGANGDADAEIRDWAGSDLDT